MYDTKKTQSTNKHCSLIIYTGIRALILLKCYRQIKILLATKLIHKAILF